MKTTIDIADSLLQEARALAAREHSTLRALIEEALRHAIDRRRQKTRFRLRDASFKGRGRGLHPDAQGLEWARIRAAAYEGRGG